MARNPFGEVRQGDAFDRIHTYVPVVQSNAADLRSGEVFVGILATAGGSITYIDGDGTQIGPVTLVAGQFLETSVKRVRSTGTSLSNANMWAAQVRKVRDLS